MLLLVAKIVQICAALILLVLLPKVSSRVKVFHVMQHSYFILASAVSVAQAVLYESSQMLLIPVFLEHLAVTNLALNLTVIEFT